LARYQQLLEQSRTELAQAQRCHCDEMQALQQQLHQRNEAAFKKYRMAIKESLSKPDNPVVTSEQVILYSIYYSDFLCAIVVFLLDIY